MLMFGRHLTLPADLEFGAPFHEVVRQCSGENTQKLRQTLWELHELTRRKVRGVTLQIKRRYDIKETPVDLRPDDSVWLYDQKKRQHRSRKLMTKWEGPTQWSKDLPMSFSRSKEPLVRGSSDLVLETRTPDVSTRSCALRFKRHQHLSQPEVGQRCQTDSQHLLSAPEFSQPEENSLSFAGMLTAFLCGLFSRYQNATHENFLCTRCL